MKASVTFAFFLLLATATRIQKVNGASPDEKQLRDAARRNNVDLVKRLLDSGVDAKATDDSLGYSALMTAAAYGNYKSVELLLPKSDVQATDNFGWSALMAAARWGKSKSVELLLPFSDVEATDRRGRNALDLAMKNGHNQIVRLLQQYSN